MNQQPRTILATLAGCSGSGKTTLCLKVPDLRREFSRVITVTTRKQRQGEINGRDYLFVSTPEIERMEQSGELLEWAKVHVKKDGIEEDRIYGTPVASVLLPLARRQDLIMNLDIQGVRSLQKLAETNMEMRQALVTIFINAPIEELRRRLIVRGQDSLEEIEHRLKAAEEEMRNKPTFDYEIASRSPDEDLESLLAIIEEARAMRPVSLSTRAG